MIEVVEVTAQLLAGETVTFHGQHARVDDASVKAPRPVQTPVPLLIGGNGVTLLAAARKAVAFSGLGRTLPDGHHHEVQWHPSLIDKRVELVQRAAEAAGLTPALAALVQLIETTDDAEAAAHRLAEQIPTATTHDILNAPYVMLGTAAEIVAEMRRHEERLGFNRFVVRAAHHELAASLLPMLSE